MLRIMSKTPFHIYVILGILLSSVSLFGQSRPSKPAVFMIGENEKAYDQLVTDYSTMLLLVCNNDLEKSFEIWTDFLHDIEDYAAQSGYDLKGAKLWINVFWDKEGKIDHIVFYPKPNAKNLNYENLKPIFESFITQYQIPVKYTTKYSHYGSANFPIMNRSVIGAPK